MPGSGIAMNASSDDRQVFRIGEFEGPLDLLLYLIRRSEINIYDIPIAEITEQYLAYLAYVIQVDLDNITEFYRMASTLLYIKSRMLLPVEYSPEEEPEDPRQDLVDRLIEYERVKKLTQIIEEQHKSDDLLVLRGSAEHVLPFQDSEMWKQVSAWDLYKTFMDIVSSLSTEKIIDLYEEVTVNEKITYINELFQNRREFSFSEIVTRRHSLLDVVCAFFAVLELVRSRQIRVFQNRLFGDIIVKRRDSD